VVLPTGPDHFAGLALIDVIGMIAWSITTHNVDGVAGHLLTSRRRFRRARWRCQRARWR